MRLFSRGVEAQWFIGHCVGGERSPITQRGGSFDDNRAERSDEIEPESVRNHAGVDESKAGILGQGDGFVKAVADAKTGEILGVHIIGVLATEQIAESVVARHFEATAEELANVVHAHPTLAEATMEAMFGTEGRAIHV